MTQRTAKTPEDHLARVRRICARFPETDEKISHGAPTFFVRKKVYVMFTNNHHGDGHIAVWIPAPGGLQEHLIESNPATYFRPPYVGHRGWVGVELAGVTDAELEAHIEEAWRMTAPKRILARFDETS